MRNLPKIAYGAKALQFKLPPPPWTPGVQAVGAGREWSAADVPASWGGSTRYTLRLNLRFYESEWPAVRAWIQHAMAGGSFSFYPDGRFGDMYTCYLLSPEPGDKVQAERDSYNGALSLEVVLCTTNGTPIEPLYYG